MGTKVKHFQQFWRFGGWTPRAAAAFDDLRGDDPSGFETLPGAVEEASDT